MFVCQKELTDAMFFLGKKKEPHRQDIRIDMSNSWYLNVPFQVQEFLLLGKQQETC